MVQPNHQHHIEMIPSIPDIEDSAEGVKKYLAWLWKSPFQYHLDDEPLDIEFNALGIHNSRSVDPWRRRLSENHMALKSLAHIYKIDLWAHYAKAVTPATFSLGDEPDRLIVNGYHQPEVKWNGWECPYFTKEDADKIVECGLLRGYNWYDHNDDERALWFDGNYDNGSGLRIRAYVSLIGIEKNDLEVEGPDVYEGEDVLTPDGLREVFPVGSHFWTWELAGQDEEAIRRRGIQNQA